MQPFIYHIGTQGQAWGEAEKQQWLAEQSIKRSYQSDVLSQLSELESRLRSFNTVSWIIRRRALAAIRYCY